MPPAADMQARGADSHDWEPIVSRAERLHAAEIDTVWRLAGGQIDMESPDGGVGNSMEGFQTRAMKPASNEA